MTIGHPELVAAITSEIRISGPIPFVRFMELALYHPRFGYYMRVPEAGAERIGWSGDFYTSSDVHPVLGQAIAKQAAQIDGLLGHPHPMMIVEMGPGKGLLARHILSACQRDFPALKERLRYVLIERSPAMREIQRANLAPWLDEPGLVTWLECIESLSTDSLSGLIFSNELPDAFPVHRIQMTNGALREIFVDCRDGRFMECLLPPSTPELERYLRRLAVCLPDGYRAEINLHAMQWMRQIAAALHRGIALTIDYGHTAQDLYGPERNQGTLLCYFSQLASDDPYTRVGLQDMTAHVDFSTLAAAGEEGGLHVTGFTNQMSFLMGLGIEEMLAGMDSEGADFRAALHLLKPDGMGRTFKVLIQHKGIERPELDGLKFQPFFGSALAPNRTRSEHLEAMGQPHPPSCSPLTPSLRV